MDFPGKLRYAAEIVPFLKLDDVTMELLLPVALYSRIGHILLLALLVVAAAAGLAGAVNLFRPGSALSRLGGRLLAASVLLFVAGFAWTGWFHYQIYHNLPLELPAAVSEMLNQQLAMMNENKAYGLPFYDQQAPPRYLLPLWLENEKYFFWVMCYAVMALYAHFRLPHHRFRGALHLLLGLQTALLFLLADPFRETLPKFFNEVGPWFSGGEFSMQRFGLFMKLYPKMVFYYNAHYMWFHPPMLFLSYACITITFVTSLFMLAERNPAIEKLGYESARLGFFLLTLGMLLGYPWALQAWGPNWWWDPKICSSIMMWAIYSTYLHTRLYVNRPSMWYFSAGLGILCFVAMLFTFLSSFFFPGEHSFVS